MDGLKNKKHLLKKRRKEINKENEVNKDECGVGRFLDSAKIREHDGLIVLTEKKIELKLVDFSN